MFMVSYDILTYLRLNGQIPKYQNPGTAIYSLFAYVANIV